MNSLIKLNYGEELLIVNEGLSIFENSLRKSSKI